MDIVITVHYTFHVILVDGYSSLCHTSYWTMKNSHLPTTKETQDVVIVASGRLLEPLINSDNNTKT